MSHTTLIASRPLRQHLDAPDWRVFDCRFDLFDPAKGRRSYQESHIPGSVYADLDHDLSGPIALDSGRHPLPAAAHFTRWLGAQGVGPNTQVVVYDDAQGAIAVRLWWMLKWLGHEAVALLDGGWQGWLGEGNPHDAQVPTPQPAEFRAHCDTSRVIDTPALERALACDQIRLIDVRTAMRFRGEQEPIDPIAGHIPGAVNLPYAEHLDHNGRFYSPAELRRRYRPILGDDSAANAVFMCGSGVTACHGLLALEHARLGRARLYPGSWSEWIRDPRRAVTSGDALK
ncbi:MAG: sulfurtransferase [Thiotrichales bacterium]